MAGANATVVDLKYDAGTDNFSTLTAVNQALGGRGLAPGLQSLRLR